MPDIHETAMRQALGKAAEAAAAGEVPVGAVVYTGEGTVLAAAHNETLAQRDPTAHAELLAARTAAARRGNPYMEDCFVAVTLEPCAMCAQALSYFRVRGIYFGAYDAKSGGVEHGARVLQHAHHRPQVVGGLLEEAAATLLRTFFQDKRA